MPTQAQFEAELELVFAAMQSLRAGDKQVMYKGRSITRNDFEELQKQYEWLEGRVSVAGAAGNRTAVASFNSPSL